MEHEVIITNKMAIVAIKVSLLVIIIYWLLIDEGFVFSFSGLVKVGKS